MFTFTSFLKYGEYMWCFVLDFVASVVGSVKYAKVCPVQSNVEACTMCCKWEMFPVGKFLCIVYIFVYWWKSFTMVHCSSD